MSDWEDVPMFDFDGETYVPDRDGVRLNSQVRRVWEIMKDGRLRTLEDISELTGDPISSISSRLRDFRKDRFGGHEVNRQWLGDGLWGYQLVINPHHRELSPLPNEGDDHA